MKTTFHICVQNCVCVVWCCAVFSTSAVCHFTFIKASITVSYSPPPRAIVSLQINIFPYHSIAFLTPGAYVGRGFGVRVHNCLCVCTSANHVCLNTLSVCSPQIVQLFLKYTMNSIDEHCFLSCVDVWVGYGEEQ